MSADKTWFGRILLIPPAFSKSVFSKQTLILLLFTLFAITSFSKALYVLRAPFAWLLQSSADDGAFYLQIAANWAGGHGVTFDRISPTNGVHWAWLGFLSAWLSLAPAQFLTDPIFLIRMAFILHFAFLFSSVFLWLRFLRNRTMELGFPLVLALSTWGMTRFFHSGYQLMESHCVFLAISVYAILLFRFLDKIKSKKYFPLWLATVFLVLCRLDLFPIVFSTIFLLAIRYRSLRTVKFVFVQLSAVSIGIFLIFTFNYLAAGRIFSVSSAIKAGGGYNNFATIKFIIAYLGLDNLRGIFILSYGAFLLPFIRSREVRGIRHILEGLLLGSLAVFVLQVLRNHGIAEWYKSSVLWINFMIAVLFARQVGLWLEHRGRAVRQIILYGPLLFLCLLTFRHFRVAAMSSDSGYSDRLLDAVQKTVKPGEFIFMEDLSGKMGLLSQRSVVNGDGLVNSFDYLDNYLTKGKVGDYILEKKISYFIVTNLPCEGEMPVSLPWIRHLDPVEKEGKTFLRATVDIGYLTNLAITPSVLFFPKENVVFDECLSGARYVMLRVPPAF